MQTIVLVKEPCVLRKGIESILNSKFPDLIVSTYSSSEQPEMHRQENIGDLLLIDIDIDVDYLKVINRYQDQYKKVIVWTSNLEDNKLIDLFQRRLNGYFYERMGTNEFVSGIRAVLKGAHYVHPAFSSVFLGEYVRRTSATRSMSALTSREWKVLELITNGYTNKKIAETLLISENTVNSHLGSIYKKLNVPDRTNAALVALKERWFV